MRALVIALLAAPLLLAGCGDHQEGPTGPATVPDVISAATVAAARSTAIDIIMEPGGPVCSQSGLIRTGTYRCKSRKLSAGVTVVDEGVVPTP